MSELSLIQRFRARAPGHPWVVVGPGQDCAVLRWPADRDLACKIDQVVEGTHFVLSGPEGASGYEVGWKAMAKACSDIAAAGCWPVAATVALNLKKGSAETLALEVFEGLAACCQRFGFALAGGDLSSSENSLSVCVSLVGEGPRDGAWLRSGAKPGDILFVTGAQGGLGGSRRSRKHLTFTPRLEEARLIRNAIGSGVHACIDITDGLSRDLHHVCAESDCGAVIFEQDIPCSTQGTHKSSILNVLEDGEDFELLLAVDPNQADGLLAQCAAQCALRRIGTITPKSEGCTLVGADGQPRVMPDLGYEHSNEVLSSGFRVQS